MTAGAATAEGVTAEGVTAEGATAEGVTMAGGQDSKVVLEPVKMVSNKNNLDLLTVTDAALL